MFQEIAEERGDDEVFIKRLAFGTSEIQRIAWRLYASVLSEEQRNAHDPKGLLDFEAHFRIRLEQGVEELQNQLSQRRQKHLEYCLAKQKSNKDCLKEHSAALEEEPLQSLYFATGIPQEPET